MHMNYDKPRIHGFLEAREEEKGRHSRGDKGFRVGERHLLANVG